MDHGDRGSRRNGGGGDVGWHGTRGCGRAGGEFFAFDGAGAVYSIPLIGMSVEDAIKVANSWAEFVQHIEPKA